MIRGLGGQSLRGLLTVFGAPEAIYAAPLNILKHHVPPAVATEIAKGIDRSKLDYALNWLRHSHNQLITLADKEYPQRLLEISDPPP